MWFIVILVAFAVLVGVIQYVKGRREVSADTAEHLRTVLRSRGLNFDDRDIELAVAGKITPTELTERSIAYTKAQLAESAPPIKAIDVRALGITSQDERG